MPPVANFAIADRKPGCNLSELIPTTPAYTLVASAIVVALELLKTPNARQGLMELALTVDATLRRPWYGSLNHSEANARRLVDYFLTKITQRFPWIIIDGHDPMVVDEPRCYGFHSHTYWRGHSFESRNQTIHLSRLHVRSMVATAMTGTTLREFQTYQFIFACVIFHELIHVFTTFLDQDGNGTPPPMTVPGYSQGRWGESGRWMENRVFGGTIEIYCDDNRGPLQPGVPHLVINNNRDAYRIRWTTIEDTINYHFDLPYRVSNNRTDASMRHLVGDRYPMYHYNPPSVNLNPQFQHVLTRGYDIRIDRESNIRVLPQNPSLGVNRV